jgi:hypothetical protein
MKSALVRGLTVAFAFLHAFPAKKHLALFVAHPSVEEAWKGFGAALAIALYLMPLRWQARALGTLWNRHRAALLAAGAALAVVHCVPAADHLPKFFASPSWADAWRGFGALMAVVWFLMPLPMQAHALAFVTSGRTIFARRAMSTAALVLGKGDMMKLALAFGSIAMVVALSGCGAHGSQAFDDNGTGGPGLGGGGGGDLGGNGGTGTQASGPVLLYAHTNTTLYQLDPEHMNMPMTRVGNFDCIGSRGAATSMTDLAVTRAGKLYGVSEGAAFPLTVQGNTVHCDATWTLPQTKFYGLTVAPENTVAANEVLIGADGSGGLYEIDQNSGTPTQVGTLGMDPKSGQPWSLSGDVVFMTNGGNPIGFATVRTCSTSGGSGSGGSGGWGGSGSGCASTDTLIEVDVKAIHPGTQSVLKAVRGPVVRGSWCTNALSPQSFGSMFGIVAYQDKVYGFSHSGDIVEIHNNDGSGCLVVGTSSSQFAGAGITTTAPVVAPPAVK